MRDAPAVDRGVGRAIVAAVMTIAGCLAVTGCASALKPPPSLVDLAGGAPVAAPEEVDALLAAAEALYRRRDLDAVTQAAHAWLRAAAADPRRVEGLVGAARAEVWVTEHAADGEVREAAARTAVHAAQWCRRIAPAEAACDYWLGAALGVQARERASTGLSALPEIEAAFKRAAAAAPELEHAGADRALALLYLRAPSWPAGPGDPELGLRHARRAVDLRPGYPPNLTALAEALAANDQESASEEMYLRALDLARSLAADGHPDGADWVASIVEKLE